ncbi:MAG TPA: hypothetical protein VK856_12620 [Anaerolineaceae bacterium]|nr:hypothetical protein [Anaerolineaceae bacterium]
MGSLVIETWKKGPGRIIFVLFTLACVISLVYFYQFNSFPRSQFKKLATTIQTIESHSIPVIHDNKLSFFPTMYYYETDFQYYLQDEPGSPNDTLAKDSQLAIGYLELNNLDDFIDEEEIIFVVFQDAITEYEIMNKKHPVLEELELLFDNNYQIFNIGDIKLFNFGSIK